MLVVIIADGTSALQGFERFCSAHVHVGDVASFEATDADGTSALQGFERHL